MSSLSRSLLAALAVVGIAASAGAITRTETIVRSKAFAFHPFTVKTANTTASCNSAYKSVYTPGDYMGLPYDWGGYMTLFDFDQQIAQGYGAGSYPEDGILSCTAGLDCSGFVSKAWDSGHWTTSSVDQTSSVISQSAMLAGDIFNDAGNHMALYSHKLGNGEPVLYESVGYNVHLSMPGWSWVAGYVPRRYSKITGTSADDPSGTTENPILIGSLPYSDSRNTASSMSDVLDGCGASPSVKETGPEYIYKLNVTQPGTLTVTAQDDVGVDIDVHLYTSMNTGDCIARGDTTLSQEVDCGTYYVVADTFAGSSGPLPGPYTLNVTFQPSSGQACGAGPKKYSFKGAMGEPCAYPGNKNLPFCNPNLGADTCLYSSTTSFCTKPCTSNSECSALPGGCCSDIGSGEKYCVIASLCGSTQVDSGVTPKPDAGDPADAGSSGGSAGAGMGGGGGSGNEPGTGGASSGGFAGAGNGPGFGGAGNQPAAGGGPAASNSGSSGGCSVNAGATRSPLSLAALLLALLLRRRRERRC